MAEYKKDYFEDRKLKFEKNHGVFIHEFMFTEFSNRILGQCNVALNDLQRQLDLEIARAKAEEVRIETKAHNELGKIYNYINPSSSTYEDVLNSQEPLKYTELAHGNGDILAENGQKDLNSAYNHSMTVLTEAFNGFKNNQISKSDLEKVFNATKFNEDDLDTVLTYPNPERNKIFQPLIINSEGVPDRAEKTTDMLTAFTRTVSTLATIFYNLSNTIYPYASCKVDTNEINISTPNNANKSLPQTLRDSYIALGQAHNTINNLYMSNNADSYKLNEQGRLVKDNQQTKLISNYNETLINITQAINRLAKKVEDLEQSKA